jgi:hypothetical protein
MRNKELEPGFFVVVVVFEIWMNIGSQFKDIWEILYPIQKVIWGQNSARILWNKEIIATVAPTYQKTKFAAMSPVLNSKSQNPSRSVRLNVINKAW